MEKVCEHNITRKLYFQRGRKWVTTDLSICEYCNKVIENKKEVIGNE